MLGLVTKQSRREVHMQPRRTGHPSGLSDTSLCTSHPVLMPKEQHHCHLACSRQGYVPEPARNSHDKTERQPVPFFYVEKSPSLITLCTVPSALLFTARSNSSKVKNYACFYYLGGEILAQRQTGCASTQEIWLRFRS